MKKSFLLLVALLGVVAINAKTIYLNTGGSALWGQSDPVFFVHSWASETDNADAQLTLVSGDLYSATIADNHNSVLFVRMPSGSTSLDWSTKWNQTADLTIPTGNNMYTITGWGATDGTWSTYSAGGTQGGGGGQNPGGQTGNPRYYYLGHIDGSDIVPDDSNYSNRFYGGEAELNVTADAYIFVLYQVDGVAGVQYMTQGYVDGPTHATVYQGIEEKGGNKFHLGAGSYTLYLYENGDGTLEISTQKIPGKKLADPDGESQAFDQVIDKKTVNKSIVNGQLVITIDGVRYNTNGVRL